MCAGGGADQNEFIRNCRWWYERDGFYVSGVDIGRYQ